MNSTNAACSTDPVHVQQRLRELLHRLLVQNSSCRFTSPEEIPIDAELSSMAVTSIDFLEFALSVEQEFHVEILEAIAPDELPLTLAAWQQQVCQRLASA